MWFIYGILTAYFGWSGGRGDDFWRKHPRWPRWALQSWTRDWVIAPLCAVALYLYGIHSWWLILLIPLTGGALSTYWDSYFGYDNFYMHGFMVGLAAFPAAIVSGAWMMFIIRTILVTAWMGVWSKMFKNPHVEDLGRYFIIGSTLWMLV